MGSSKEFILKTLLYGDIFDYPLLPEEIWWYLVSGKKQNYRDFIKQLNLKNSLFDNKNGYFFVKGRESLVFLRKTKEKQSIKKIKFAKKIITYLTKIPTVRFIGISGALSMKNSAENDDIDLFIISSKNSVWTTRLISVLILKMLGVYRGRNEKDVSNKICLNMLIDQTGLSFPKKRRDLYTAHEIAQIMPIFQKDNTYEEFIKANDWVKSFLPNAFDKQKKFLKRKSGRLNNFFITVFKVFPPEVFLKNIQVLYMKNRLSKEIILNNFIAFHPFDYRSFVLKTYKKKLEKFDIVF